MRRVSTCIAAVALLATALAAAPVSVAGADHGPYPPACCAYRFRDPWLPNFALPAPQPNSPGDVRVNPLDNPIINAADGSVAQGCNGDDFQYWDPLQAKWIDNFVDTQGTSRQFQHMFYTTGSDALMISTLQTWQSGLARLLDQRVARLLIKCNNADELSCVQFTVGATQDDPAVADRDRSVTSDCLVSTASVPDVSESNDDGSGSGSNAPVVVGDKDPFVEGDGSLDPRAGAASTTASKPLAMAGAAMLALCAFLPRLL